MTSANRIPPFKTLEEEALFWDTHDTTDYEDAFQTVQVHFANQLSRGVTIRLQPADFSELRMLARNKGIGASSLVRMWVKKMLHKEKHHLV